MLIVYLSCYGLNSKWCLRTRTLINWIKVTSYGTFTWGWFKNWNDSFYHPNWVSGMDNAHEHDLKQTNPPWRSLRNLQGNPCKRRPPSDKLVQRAIKGVTFLTNPGCPSSTRYVHQLSNEKSAINKPPSNPPFCCLNHHVPLVRQRAPHLKKLTQRASDSKNGRPLMADMVKLHGMNG